VCGHENSETAAAVKLFSKNFNLYDHDTSTLQTDEQTDGQLGLAIPRYAMLRAINIYFYIIYKTNSVISVYIFDSTKIVV